MPRKKDKKKRTNHVLSLTIARSISEIIKFSVDNEFRERSFKILGVICTKDAKNEVYKKLLASTENPNSLVPQTVTSDEDNVLKDILVTENQSVQKSQHINLSESLSQSEEKCEECLNGYNPDLSQTIFSQICLQISQEQEQRRLREKNILLNTNLGIITP